MIDTRIIIVGAVSIICIATALFWALTPSTTPWTDTGRLVLLAHAAPGAPEETVFEIGIDNIELYSDDGEITRVTVRNRRVQLIPEGTGLQLVLDTSVPVGTYAGFRFTIKSPALRNAWEQDLAPEYVTMLNENIILDVPYTIEKDVTSAIVLAFETTRAIYEKDTQHYYLPIIQIETRRNAAIESSQESTTVKGGVIEHNATFGMDWSGRMRFNYREKPYVQKTQDRTHTPYMPLEDTKEVPAIEKQATSTATTTDPQATNTATSSEATTTSQATSTR